MEGWREFRRVERLFINRQWWYLNFFICTRGHYFSLLLERERERERETSVWGRTMDWKHPVCSLTKNWAGPPDMSPDWESSLRRGIEPATFWSTVWSTGWCSNQQVIHPVRVAVMMFKVPDGHRWLAERNSTGRSKAAMGNFSRVLRTVFKKIVFIVLLFQLSYLFPHSSLLPCPPLHSSFWTVKHIGLEYNFLRVVGSFMT